MTTERDTSFFHLFVLERPAAGREYRGYDRLDLVESDEVDEDELRLLNRLCVPGEATMDELKKAQAFWRDGRLTDYELLCVGEKPGAEWTFLGCDIGEMPPHRWSALANLDTWANGERRDEVERRLNMYGLISRRSDAQRVLEMYLESPDDDFFWSGDDPDELAELYDVLPVYLFDPHDQCDEPDACD